MKIQNLRNHKRFYYPHHFVFYPVILILTGISIFKGVNNFDRQTEYFLFAAVFLILGWLSFMLRQHYALTTQNRIVRLELRLRYYQLTQKRLEDVEEKLTFAQLAALRFASDKELEELVQLTLKENLSPYAIKSSIKSWLSDHMRV